MNPDHNRVLRKIIGNTDFITNFYNFQNIMDIPGVP